MGWRTAYTAGFGACITSMYKSIARRTSILRLSVLLAYNFGDLLVKGGMDRVNCSSGPVSVTCALCCACL